MLSLTYWKTTFWRENLYFPGERAFDTFYMFFPHAPSPPAGWFTGCGSIPPGDTISMAPRAANSAASASSASLCFHAKFPAKLVFDSFRPLPLGLKFRYLKPLLHLVTQNLWYPLRNSLGSSYSCRGSSQVAGYHDWWRPDVNTTGCDECEAGGFYRCQMVLLTGQVPQFILVAAPFYGPKNV